MITKKKSENDIGNIIHCILIQRKSELRKAESKKIEFNLNSIKNLNVDNDDN